MTHMVGSYAPKATIYSYTTPVEDAPSGFTGRGKYHVSSLFTDDDKHEHLKVAVDDFVLTSQSFLNKKIIFSGNGASRFQKTGNN